MNPELTPLIEEWVRVACRYYMTKNPTIPAMLWGSVAKYLTDLSDDVPRDVDILPREAVNKFAFKYIDHSGNLEAYPILLEGSTEFEGVVRMPNKIGLMAAKLACDSLERMPITYALLLKLSTTERGQVRDILVTLPETDKIKAGIKAIDDLIPSV